MGTCGTTSSDGADETVDKELLQSWVHELPQNQRKQRLIDGYIRSISKLKKIIPDDIKSILKLYLNSMNKIKSQIEIEKERKRQEELVLTLQ